MHKVQNRTVTSLIQLTTITFLAMALMSFMFIESSSAPKAELWQRWKTFNPASRETIDHRQWDRFLRIYIKQDNNNINRVAYDQLGAGGKSELEEYLKLLGGTPISLFARNEQKAFWINLYNALTVQLIAEYYPVASIRDIPLAWDKKLAKIENVGLSLNDIEHRILRPIWHDARIHYTINCGALGFPNLLKVAFTGRNTSQLTELAAHNYINQHRGAHIKDGSLIVSKIYNWYKEDFGGTDQSVIAHLRTYAEFKLLEELKKKEYFDNYEFDWGLNDTGS